MKARTPKTAARTRVAPLGLRAIFAALQFDAYRANHGATDADDYADVPANVLRALQHKSADDKSADLTDVIFEAAEREFPDGQFGPDGTQSASECPETVAIGAFWAGVATCWYVMNAINGKDGAR